MRVALSIAGSDSSGGAGIQADLKTFQALGVFGMSAVTAVTVQNTQKVFAIQEMRPEIVRGQIVCLFEDIPVPRHTICPSYINQDFLAFREFLL